MKPFRWRHTRVPRPVDRPVSEAPSGRFYCPFCGADGAVIDFQRVRCPAVECRYFDPKRADEIDMETIERNRIAQEEKDMSDWSRRWGNP